MSQRGAESTGFCTRLGQAGDAVTMGALPVQERMFFCAKIYQQLVVW